MNTGHHVFFIPSREKRKEENSFAGVPWVCWAFFCFCWCVSPIWAQDFPTRDSVQDSTGFDQGYVEDGNESLSGKTFARDTFPVSPRKLNESKLEQLKKSKDFDYSEPPTVGESLWDRFWRWISELLADLFRGAVNTHWGRVLLYAGCLVVLIFIVMALLKVDGFKVLFQGANSPSSAGVFHENIHTMDFETLVREATEQGDFRNAVRLIFLFSLKILSDGHHIHWAPGKTNHDYLEELKNTPWRPGLGELSFYFDYVWYGGFAITSSQFDKVNNIFNTWRAGIR